MQCSTNTISSTHTRALNTISYLCSESSSCDGEVDFIDYCRSIRREVGGGVTSGEEEPEVLIVINQFVPKRYHKPRACRRVRNNPNTTIFSYRIDYCLLLTDEANMQRSFSMGDCTFASN